MTDLNQNSQPKISYGDGPKIITIELFHDQIMAANGCKIGSISGPTGTCMPSVGGCSNCGQ